MKPMRRHVWKLEETLTYIQTNHLFLIYTDSGPDLWTAGRKMPQPLRRAIFVYRDELARMMQAGKWEVCPNPMLHKRYTRNKTACGVCKRMETDAVKPRYDTIEKIRKGA